MQGMAEWLLNHIARPVMAGMKSEGAEYRGILYCGLMMTARGPMVLEFNCRFGDPETQAVLMRLDSDLLDAIEAAVEGRVSDGDFKWSSDASCCVVVASGGYPGSFMSGKQISGLDRAAQLGEREGLPRRHQQARWRLLHQRRPSAGRHRAGAAAERRHHSRL